MLKKDTEEEFDFTTESNDLYNYVDSTHRADRQINTNLLNRLDYFKSLQNTLQNIISHPYTNKNVLFIGDSITYGANTTKTYHAYLNEMIQFSSYSSNGISGRCYSVTSNYETRNNPLAQNIQSIDISNKDLITIFMGTNDFGHNTPLGEITDTTDVSFYGAINYVINYIITNNPSARLILITPLHRLAGSTYSDKQKNGQDLNLIDYINAIKSIIDLYRESGLDPNISSINSTYFADGLHPNASGHERIAKFIYNKLFTL